jgi:membrane protease YdiL (CAAX protease family)
MTPLAKTESPRQRSPWQELGAILAGFLCIWLAFDRTAQLTHSTLGEAGVLICAVVVATALVVEKLLFNRSLPEALRALGLGYPHPRTMLVALFVSAMLLAFYPAFSLVTGAKLTWRDNWFWLAVGLFAQAGIAEEVLFRGYLFGHFRNKRTFWHAAMLSLLPFVAVHLLLFASLDWSIALASTLLSVATVFPFCYICDRNRRTIWASAVIHWVIQGAIELVIVPDGFYLPVAIGWMTICATVPYFVFAFRKQEDL